MNQGLGSGEFGQFTFLDMVSITSFLVGIMNLNENLTQGDKQDILSELSNKADALLKEIHAHLEEQDKKIDLILEKLEELNRE